MNNIFGNKIKLLNLENLMYLLFIIASLINISANEKIKNLNINNIKPGNTIRNEYIVSSYIILLVFIVFMLRNYNNLKKLSPTEPEYQYAKLRFYGSLFIVLGQLLIIYYFQNTTNFN